MSPLPAMRHCAAPGCSAIVRGGYCPDHARQRERQRPNADFRKLYYSARWVRLRASVLAEEPLCRECQAQGTIEPATDVDHIRPHRGNLARFWARANLQALCHACHSRKTQRGE